MSNTNITPSAHTPPPSYTPAPMPQVGSIIGKIGTASASAPAAAAGKMSNARIVAFPAGTDPLPEGITPKSPDKSTPDGQTNATSKIINASTNPVGKETHRTTFSFLGSIKSFVSIFQSKAASAPSDLRKSVMGSSVQPSTIQSRQSTVPPSPPLSRESTEVPPPPLPPPETPVQTQTARAKTPPPMPSKPSPAAPPNLASKNSRLQNAAAKPPPPPPAETPVSSGMARKLRDSATKFEKRSSLSQPHAEPKQKADKEAAINEIALPSTSRTDDASKQETAAEIVKKESHIESVETKPTATASPSTAAQEINQAKDLKILKKTKESGSYPMLQFHIGNFVKFSQLAYETNKTVENLKKELQTANGPEKQKLEEKLTKAEEALNSYMSDRKKSIDGIKKNIDKFQKASKLNSDNFSDVDDQLAIKYSKAAVTIAKGFNSKTIPNSEENRTSKEIQYSTYVKTNFDQSIQSTLMAMYGTDLPFVSAPDEDSRNTMDLIIKNVVNLEPKNVNEWKSLKKCIDTLNKTLLSYEISFKAAYQKGANGRLLEVDGRKVQVDDLSDEEKKVIAINVNTIKERFKVERAKLEDIKKNAPKDSIVSTTADYIISTLDKIEREFKVAGW